MLLKVNTISRLNLLKMLLSTIFIFTNYFLYVKYVDKPLHKPFQVKLILGIAYTAANDFAYVYMDFEA